MLFSILAIGLAVTTVAHTAGQWVPLNAGPQEDALVTLIEAGPERTVVELRLSGYWLDQVEIDGQPHTMISLPGRPTLMEKGLPDLPTIRERLVVPDDAHMTVRVLEAQEIEVPTLRIAPSKGHLTRNIDPATVPYEFDGLYQSDTWYPERDVDLSRPFIVRDYRGVSLQLNPIQYNPVQGRLRVYTRMVVEVSSDGPGRINLKRRTKNFERVDSDFDALYDRFFLNYSAAKYTTLPEQGRMLIVCYNGFAGDIQPLYEWKLQKGIPTKLALYPDSTGSGASALQSYIQDEYDSPEGLTYILLVGDSGQIPTNSGTAEGAPSDPCYVKLEGGDHYPDAFISRLSATTSAQVDNQVEKFIDYEADPDTGPTAAAWYHKGTGVASDESGGTGLTDYERMDLLRTDLMGYTYTLVDQIYDPGATAAQVTTAVNNGRSIINYIGHGSGTSWSTTGFSVSHVNALSNGRMLSFVCDVSCLNGYFTRSGGDCFAEAWLKAGTVGSPKGGVAHYAASTNASWVPPCVMQGEVVDLLVAEQKHTFGGLCFNGVMMGMDAYPGYEGTKLMEQYHIFGDCSVPIRTDVPATMAVSHAAVIFVDASSYDVQVTGLEGALVSLYHNGIFYGSALTNGAGNAAINLLQSFPGPGQVTLTVTAYNRVPYIVTLDVVTPSGPYLVYHAHQVDDTAGGNGDGMVNPGETIEMPVTLRNAGADPATAVSAVLKIQDPYVTIMDANEDYGDVPAGSTAVSAEDYDFQVLGGCPDGHVLAFDLEITSAETTWLDHGLNIIVAAPVLAYDSHIIDDGAGGNGQPDPDETFKMTIFMKNWGSGTATGVSAQMSSSDPYVGVPADLAGYGDILPGQTEPSLAQYTLTISAGCPPGHTADLVLNITADGSYSETDNFQISIGQKPILLVDDDAGDGFESYWVNALDANGYAYQTWNVGTKGSPPEDSLNQYRIILWTTGDDYGSVGSPSTLTATDQANLQAYLDAGGNLFLSSQDLLYDNDPNTFITDYLHVADHDDDTHPTQENGVSGDPISDGMVLPLSFPSGFSNWGDDISPDGAAAGIFENTAYSSLIFSREGPSYQAEPVKSGGGRAGPYGAVRYPAAGSSTFKTVFFAFGFEAISTTAGDPNNQETVMAKVIDWFMGDVIPPSQVPGVTVTLNEDQLLLEWVPASDNKGVNHYVVYRNTQPGFVPDSGDSIGSATDTFYVDFSSGIGDTLVNHCYCVKAVDAAGNKSIASGQIGEFDTHLITREGLPE